ncbi:MAG: hypothetical protein ACKOFB_06870, partial [bacterium]
RAYMNTHLNSRIEHGNMLLDTGRFEDARTYAMSYVAELKSGTSDPLELYEALHILAFSYIRRTLASDAIPVVKEMLALCSYMPEYFRKEFMLHMQITHKSVIGHLKSNLA